MKRPDIPRLTACGLALIAVACGASPTAPGAAERTAQASEATFTVIDGWSRAPVVGAVVAANGLPAVTDAAGQVHFPATKSCLTLDVTVAGYLERRTCVAPGPVTLWPVANAEEAEVTRQWIFTRDQIHGDFWSTPTLITLSPELAARAEVAATWKAATDLVTQVTQGRITFQWVPNAPEEGVLIETAGAIPSCRVTPWPVDIGGFCIAYDPDVYYLDRLRMSSDKVADPTAALRALLSAVGIRAHSLPGLMNTTRPQPELTEFERKTLGMLGIRRRTVTWPDFDQMP